MDKARTAAWCALRKVQADEGYSNIVLDKTIKNSQLDARDAAFASTLFYGVLEKKIPLDHCLKQFSKIPLQKIDPGTLEILRMAVYQILYMDKVPDSAAVNEAVQLAKEQKLVKAAGFINGVLRNVIRKKQQIRWPDADDGSLEALSVRFSCPKELISFWQKAYGAETAEKILSSLQEHPPIYIRINPLRCSLEEMKRFLEEKKVNYTEDLPVSNCLALWNPGSFTEWEPFRKGWFHVQDLSSQICCAFLSPEPGERVIDVCAAPGGKSFTLAEYMENRGELLSFDKYKGKVNLIRSGAERLELSCIRAGVRDAVLDEKNLQLADKVLCDVPCSGFGILRRKPEIRYKSLKELDSLPNLQYLILCKTSNLVRPGGRLLYSTCTLAPKENGQIADRFLKEHPEFEPYPLPLPSGVSHEIMEADNQLTIFPHTCGSDGFFVAAFQRKQEKM